MLISIGRQIDGGTIIDLPGSIPGSGERIERMDFWTFFYDYGLLLVIAAAIFGLAAQGWMQSSFRKYGKVHARKGVTGKEAAEAILRAYSLRGSEGAHEMTVHVERVAGNLTDHYSPREKTLRLSDSTYGSTSIAAIGVAAHECGHAMQDAGGFLPNKIRSAIAPAAGFGTQAGPYLALLGLFLGNLPLGDILFMIGIFAYFLATLFFLVTLPVEINASRRALKILDNTGLLGADELPGARKVLSAAAMTYVAAAASAVLTLLRLLGARRRRG